MSCQGKVFPGIMPYAEEKGIFFIAVTTHGQHCQPETFSIENSAVSINTSGNHNTPGLSPKNLRVKEK